MAAGTVHYKFKSALQTSAVTFDGVFITVADLKRAIVEQAGLAEGTDCDLVVTNAQTNEGEPAAGRRARAGWAGRGASRQGAIAPPPPSRRAGGRGALCVCNAGHYAAHIPRRARAPPPP